MKQLLFYNIDKNYINYLSKFDKHISYNKHEQGHSRPYLGIVFKVQDFEYFAPLYSYKRHYEKYKNNPSFFFVYNRKNQPLSIIKFSAMIPVLPKSNMIVLLNYNEENKKYRDLISAEYRYINSKKEEIYIKANKMYLNVTKENTNNFFKTISCDFKLLEKKCLIYKNTPLCKKSKI